MNVAHFRRRRALLSSPPAHFKLWPDLPASRSLVPYAKRLFFVPALRPTDSRRAPMEYIFNVAWPHLNPLLSSD